MDEYQEEVEDLPNPQLERMKGEERNGRELKEEGRCVISNGNGYCPLDAQELDLGSDKSKDLPEGPVTASV